MKNRKKKKSLRQMYGDTIYSEPAMKKSQGYLIGKANMSLRTAFANMEDLLEKSLRLAEIGEASRSEVRILYGLSRKLMEMVDNFKHSLMR
jgi:hypothetical protein